MEIVKNINFKSLVFAGFAAGYIMYFVDFWFAGLLGLFGLFPGTKDTWWMITHHIDAILIGLLFAWPAVYGKLPGASWLKGLVFGLGFWILTLIVGFIAGALGAKMFSGGMPGSAVVSSLLLHLVYGFFLGVLYVPPASE